MYLILNTDLRLVLVLLKSFSLEKNKVKRKVRFVFYGHIYDWDERVTFEQVESVPSTFSFRIQFKL